MIYILLLLISCMTEPKGRFAIKCERSCRNNTQVLNEGCGVCYVGETTRHFEQRVKEHLSTDTSSAVFKHLEENSHCRKVCNNNCFSILDRAHTKFQLCVKEALYIKMKKPILNQKVKSYSPNSYCDPVW